MVGEGPVRTGVTVILPHDGEIGAEPLFAGSHVLNGNGEMTGLLWVKESGMLTSPIAITNTHSVGVVRDALISYEVQRTQRLKVGWSLPVVAETYDGWLNDINGMHVKPEHVWAALDAASDGPVAEGCVGGGTGMICHEFKGGIGTSSRVLSEEDGGWTVGVLVQANYGARHLLRIDGVPVGELIPCSEVPGFREERARLEQQEPGRWLDHHRRRHRRPAPAAPVRAAGAARHHRSGPRRRHRRQLLRRHLPRLRHRQPRSAWRERSDRQIASCRMIANDRMTPLFEACAEATEEAILNALCMATTTTGIDGRTMHALPLDRVREICAT